MSSPASPSHAPHVIEDCRGVLQLLSDGTVLRSSTPLSQSPRALDSTHRPDIDFKDAQFDATHDLTLRLYKPRGPHRSKLPVLFFFHGGGFCFGSFACPPFHNVCLRLAADLNALVVAPDYRLASAGHRLPAAIHDAVTAVNWLRPESDPFLSNADFNNIFISGESAGGNITHHLALKLGPTRINGYILLQPFFGGVERTESEAHCHGTSLTLEQSDRYWQLALPVGSTRDDPLANPFGPGGPRWEEAEVGPMLVVAGERDLLRDRDVEYGKRLREFGKKVDFVEIEGADHGFFSVDPQSPAADELVSVIKRFLEENGFRSL